jgi:hypothetical protein
MQLIPATNFGSSPALVEAEFSKVYNETKSLNFNEIIKKDRTKKILLFFSIAAILCLGCIGGFNGMTDA